MNSLIYNDDDDDLNYYDENLDQTENKITLLSRQLKTYLNYRESTILAICRDFENHPVISKSHIVQKLEKELIMLYLEYTGFLEKYIGPKENIKMKVLILAKKTLSFPNSPEARAFNRFLKSKIRLWELFHILSGLEIHMRPQLLKQVIQMLTKFCIVENKINVIIPDFFQQLKFNYQQLEREYDQLLLTKKNEQNKSKNKKKKVMIRE